MAAIGADHDTLLNVDLSTLRVRRTNSNCPDRGPSAPQAGRGEARAAPSPLRSLDLVLLQVERYTFKEGLLADVA